MFCHNCGSPHAEDSVFCPSCGVRLHAAPAAAGEIAPDPVPAPVPEPIPAPAPEPVPAPVPEPIPAPAPEPVPAPEPIAEPSPEPVPVPASAPAPAPARKGRRFLRVAAILLVIGALAALNAYQYITHSRESADSALAISSLESELTTKKTELDAQAETIVAQAEKLDEQEDTISEQDAALSELKDTVTSHEATISSLRDQITAMENEAAAYVPEFTDADVEKLEFMDDFIVIVPDDNSYVYHKYGCSDLSLSSFWACNVGIAEELGCTPCSLCN